jgi:chromate reductase
MPTPYSVAVIVGSLRKESFSLKIANALAKLAPDTLLQASNAVLFVTPEYNRSISGVLKNAIDVGSRPYGKSSFNGKPTGIVSNSPGPLGGVSAAKQLQNILPGICGPIMQQPEIYLNNVGDAFDDKGDLIKEPLQKVLKQYIDAFAVFIERHHR